MIIDAKLIEKNKRLLLLEQRRLEEMLSRIAKRDQTAGGYHPRYPEFGSKEDENAAEVTVYETNLAEGADLESRLRKVKAALQRMAAGTYGICQNGGEPMSPERLQAVPEAESCVEHANQKL